MPRKKGQRKRATTVKKTAASGKSKPKSVHVTETTNLSLAERRLIYAERQKRRKEEKLAKGRDYARRRRATMSLEEKTKFKERRKEYLNNLPLEEIRKRQERNKQYQRIARAQKSNLRDDNDDEEGSSGDELLVKLRPTSLQKRKRRSDLPLEKLVLVREQDKQRQRISRNARFQRSNSTEEDSATIKSMDDYNEEETSGDELLVILKHTSVTNNDSDVSTTSKIEQKYPLHKRKRRSDLPLEKLLKVRERDKQRQRIARAKRFNLSEEDNDTLESNSDNNDNDDNEKYGEEVPVGLSPSIRKSGRPADLSRIREKDALQKQKRRSYQPSEELLKFRERDRLRKRIERAKKAKKNVNDLQSDSANNDDDEKETLGENVTNNDNDVSSITITTSEIQIKREEFT